MHPVHERCAEAHVGYFDSVISQTPSPKIILQGAKMWPLQDSLDLLVATEENIQCTQCPLSHFRHSDERERQSPGICASDSCSFLVSQAVSERPRRGLRLHCGSVSAKTDVPSALTS